MRVLVTGGAGFLGSHVADMLLAKGHCVTILDNLSSGTSANVPAGVALVEADVRASLDDIFIKFRPSVVIHLAAQVSVPRSIVAPEHDLDVNVGGTVNVMETASRTGVRKVVAVSSAAVYGVPETLPLTESSTTSPVSPYGLSKLMSEQYIRMLGNLRGVGYTILRPANLYGPRQLAEGEGAVVPAFLNKFLSLQDPVIQGDGAHTRDFIHVKDMAQALLQSLDFGDGMTLNVSSGLGVTVYSLWKELAEILNWTRLPVFGPSRVGDIPHSVLANRAATQALNWHPTIGLRNGLMETVRWNDLRLAAAAEQG